MQKTRMSPGGGGGGAGGRSRSPYQQDLDNLVPSSATQAIASLATPKNLLLGTAGTGAAIAANALLSGGGDDAPSGDPQGSPDPVSSGLASTFGESLESRAELYGLEGQTFPEPEDLSFFSLRPSRILTFTSDQLNDQLSELREEARQERERDPDYQETGESLMARALVNEAQYLNEETDTPFTFTYEQLRTGQGEGLSGRPFSDEAIITLLSNARDFGRYEGRGGTVLRATGAGARENIGAGLGFGAGFAGGLKAVSPTASAVGRLPLPGVAAPVLSAALYTLGGLGGGIVGSIAGREAQEALEGEPEPVLPSFRPYYVAGETTAMSGAGLISPLGVANYIRPTEKTVRGTGAIEFINNFRALSGNTRSTPGLIQNIIENSGLPQNAINQALAAKNSSRMARFGEPTAPSKFLGIPYTPGGYVFDPTKGPLSLRTVSALEKGINQTAAQAFGAPVTFGLVELSAGASAGVAGGMAERISPNDPGTRLIAELIGATGGATALGLLKYTAGRMLGAGRQAMGFGKATPESPNVRAEAARRVLTTLQQNTGFSDDQIRQLVDDLTLDADGNVRLFAEGETVSSLADSLRLPNSAVLTEIEAQLSREVQDLAQRSGRARQAAFDNNKKLLSLAVSNPDPESLSRNVQALRGIFEESFIRSLDERIKTFNTSAQRIYGANLQNAPEDFDLPNRIFDIIEREIETANNRQSRLWREVDESGFNLTKFTHAQTGEPLGRPNVLEIFDTPASARFNGNQYGLALDSRTAESYLATFETRLRESKLKRDVSRVRDEFEETGTVNSPLLAQMYSRARHEQREAEDQNTGRLFGILANSILHDLTGQENSGSVAYEAARQYTYAMHQFFDRQIFGEMARFRPSGERVLNPLNVLESSFGGKYSTVTNNLQALLDAADFNRRSLLAEVGIDGTVRSADDEYNSVQEAATDTLYYFLRTKLLRNQLDPIKTGPASLRPTTTDQGFTVVGGRPELIVRREALEQLKQDPAFLEMVKMFPSLETTLDDVASAQNAVDQLINNPLTANYNLGIQPYEATFRRVMGSAKAPHLVVSEILESRNVENGLRDLAELTRLDPEVIPEGYNAELARQGLVSAILQHASTRAGGMDSGAFNPGRMKDVLFSRPANVAEGVTVAVDGEEVPWTLVNWMRSEGIIDADWESHITDTLDTMVRLQDGLKRGDRDPNLFPEPSASSILAAKATGSGVALGVLRGVRNLLNRITPFDTGGIGAAGLIVAGEGSKFGVNVLVNGPEENVVKAMVDIMSNPALFRNSVNESLDGPSGLQNLGIIGDGFAQLARQAQRRAPYVGQYVMDSGEVESLEPPQQPQPPAPAPVAPPTQVSNLMPVPDYSNLTQNFLNFQNYMGESLSPMLQGPAQGPVNPEDYARVFSDPNDINADIVQGIGSLGRG